jgi:hypothetical protein
MGVFARDLAVGLVMSVQCMRLAYHILPNSTVLLVYSSTGVSDGHISACFRNASISTIDNLESAPIRMYVHSFAVEMGGDLDNIIEAFKVFNRYGRM